VRRALAAALVLTLVGTAACGGSDDERTAATTGAATTTAPAKTAVRKDCEPGVHEFTLKNGRPAQMLVTQPGKRPYALVVALHGSGGAPNGAIQAFAGAWALPGLVFVAPASKGPTWSVVTGGLDIDLQSVDLAVAETWKRCPLAHDRIALGGFSDGATYALTLGVANGDLFPAIIALSPGGILADERRGNPRIFVSHGTDDDVLPIAGASNAIVPVLRKAGYEVTYRRFRGTHEVPDAVSKAAVHWFLDGLD
jgi:predicted esterase